MTLVDSSVAGRSQRRTIIGSERAWQRLRSAEIADNAFSIREIRSTNVIVIHAETSAQWAASLWSRVAELSALRRDWDSYGALPLQLHAIEALQATMKGITENVKSVPLVSLTADGGLLCEWLGAEQSLSLSISGVGEVRVHHEDRLSGAEWEGSLSEVTDLDKKVWHSSL